MTMRVSLSIDPRVVSVVWSMISCGLMNERYKQFTYDECSVLGSLHGLNV